MNISPIWEVKDDWIQPVCFEVLPPLAHQIIEILDQRNHGDFSIFLRGSCVEQVDIHPKSDIDILIVSEQRYPPIFMQELEVFQRFVDAVVISRDDEDPVYSTLLYTRSVQVSGQKISPKPVQITKKWLFAHWLKYGVNRLPPVLKSQGSRRVAELKQMIRSIGLIWYMKEREISRDISVCLGWASTLDRNFGTILQEQFSDLSQEYYEPFEASEIVEWLGAIFYQEWDQFTSRIMR